MQNPKPKSAKPELPVLAFSSDEAFAEWLAQQHQSSEGIWLRIYKVKSGVPTVTYAGALDAALCYGWIDGQKKSFDAESWLQRFTPRRPKSIWSKKNQEHVERLLQAGRMQAAGLAQVSAAKADGRWEQAYDSSGKMQVPDDFLKALHKDPKAEAFYKTLNRANVYAIAWRLQTAKKPETRSKRMQAILEMLRQGEKFHL